MPDEGYMASKRENYDNEIINLRAFYLTLLRRIWILPVAAITGGIIAGIIYFLANVVYAPARNYVTESTLYIYFAYDENKGAQVDSYNAYTWNLLVKTEDNSLGGIIENETDYNILNGIMENLSQAGYKEGENITRDEVIASINADIPSDVRVMIFTVKNSDVELSGAIADAANAALISYGKADKALTEIKLLGRGETRLELLPDRLWVAIALGAVIGFIISVLALLIIRSMDDSVFIPEDIERRYSLPVLGVISPAGEKEPSFFRNELLFCFKENFIAGDRIALISSDDVQGTENAMESAERLKEIIGDGLRDEMPQLCVMPLPGNDNESREKLSHVDGAIILVNMGEHNGSMTEHLISLLNKLKCKVYGVIIADADMKFLSRYLGL